MRLSVLPDNGFHVARALVGSDCTLFTILEATLNLVPNPGARSLLLLGYPDIFQACDHLMQILEFHPTALEGIDHLLYEYVKAKGDKEANIELLPPGKSFLMVEFGGDSKRDADANTRSCMDALKKSKNPPGMRLVDDDREETALRQAGRLPARTKTPPRDRAAFDWAPVAWFAAAGAAGFLAGRLAAKHRF